MEHPDSPWKLFEASCDRYPDEPVLIYNDCTYSYAEMRERSLGFAELIARWDFTMGGLLLPNCTAYLSTMLGFNAASKPFATLSYQFKGQALFELLDYADVEVLVTDAKGWDTLQPYADRLPIRALLVLQADDTFVVHEWPDKERRQHPGIGPDTFALCFTSGSTSRPKGIILSNRAVAGNAVAIAEHLGYKPGERTIIPRSLAQSSPIGGDVFMAISGGGAIILLNNLFHPAIFLKAIADYKATQFFIVRTMLLQVLEYPHLGDYDTSSLARILIGGMMSPLVVFQEAARLIPTARLYNAYGCSEGVARVTFCEHEETVSLQHVVGRPIKGCAITIVREDGTEADIGEVGEFCIKSDYLMDGYYKQERVTREAFTEHGFRVRDVGYRDEAGRYYALGRADDMIVQGGSMAYPVDIEEVLLRHPAVGEAVVLGAADRRLGQRIVAFVSLRPDAAAEEKALFQWCRAELQDRLVPKEIHIVEHIPRTVIGKINRKEIAQAYSMLLNKEEAIS